MSSKVDNYFLNFAKYNQSNENQKTNLFEDAFDRINKQNKKKKEKKELSIVNNLFVKLSVTSKNSN